MLVKENTSESGHWYLPDGSPAYRTIGKNGKERNTTVKDARGLGLLPSVTTIIGCAAKPALDVWKQQQAILAALTLPRLEGESEEDWLSRVVSDSKETAKQAAERGTHIHGIIESFYEGVYIPELPPYVRVVESVINEHFGPQLWVSEKSFAYGGYGGKCDLIAKGCVVDFKTTEKDLDKLDYYFDHQMQLAAYRQGFEMPTARCAIVYVNALQNKAKLVEIPEDDLRIGWDCFTHLLAFYRAKNKL
tara:strand:+ start:1172 stop:1912 length:741 start_codon:yes stop_codon:yes gene_type:complete